MGTITAGATYTLQFQVRPNGTTARNVQVEVYFYDVNGKTLSYVTSGKQLETVGAWKTFKYTFTPPSKAKQVIIDVVILNAAAGETHYVDAFILEKSSTYGTYFDGSTPATAQTTYAWTGTVGLSTSTAQPVVGTFDYADPVQWQNILGPTSNIDITREALNVGTLSATVLDAMLDPAIADTIRPGKRVRLRAFANNGWYTAYTGVLTEANTTYDKPKTPNADVRTIITISASDNIATLANQAEQYVISSIAPIPGILEDKGVPWNVNGSGNQAQNWVAYATNDNASTVDILAIARDTAGGYVWVDRFNVLQAWDASQISTGLKATFTDTLNGEFITNPGFETDLSGWAFDACTGVRVTSQAAVGAASLQATATGAGMAVRWGGTGLSGIPVQPNAAYTFRAQAKAGTTARFVSLRIDWYDSTGAFISTDIPTQGNTSLTAWTAYSGTATSPANAAYAAFRVVVAGSVAGEIYYFDDVHVIGPGGPVTLLSYTDVAVDFSMDTCINSVNITYLRYDSTTQQTSEVAYGPYQDAASIAKWGVHSADFTIVLPSESAVAVAAVAQRILAANSVPSIKCHSLTMTVRSESEIGYAAGLDLYDLVHVTYADKVDKDHRITAISHSISADPKYGFRWLTTYGFDNVGSVAQSTWVPSPSTPQTVSSGTIQLTPTMSGLGDPSNFFIKQLIPGVVAVSGYLDVDDTDSTRRDTGMRIPAGWEPLREVIVSAPRVDGTNGYYRYFFEPATGAKPGWIEFQQSGGTAHGPYESISAVWFTN